MNRNALLASAAAIDSLIALNSGQVALAQASFNFPITVNQTTGPAVQVITVGSTINPACIAQPAGTCTYQTPAAAFAGIGTDYSKVYDLQIEPDTYVYHQGDKGKIDFNGTIEGMGTIATGITLGNGTVVSTTAPGVVIVNYGAGAQALWIEGTQNSPYPGNNLVIKNIEFNGTVTSTTPPSKQGSCLQMQAIGNVLIQNDAFVNCQMGIVGDPWTPTDGSGVLLISGSVFQNNCSNSGPSHSIYESTGTLAVGRVTVSMNGVNVTGLPNTFGECSIGYNTKSRAWNTFIEGNVYYQNFVCASSGAIDVPESATLVATGNTITLGPLTGNTCNTATTATDSTRVGGSLGSYSPSNWLFQGNTIIVQGATKAIQGLFNIQNLPGTVTVSNNKFPLPSQMSNALIGLGTVAAGNIYADGSTITPSVNTQLIQNFALLADYRGTGGPQSGSPAGQSLWGGNGLLTVNYNNTSGGMVAGGPGGANVTFPHGGNYLHVWTVPGSSNTINAVNGNFEFYTAGANDQVGIGTIPGSSGPLCASKNPIMALAGTTTVTFNAHNGTTGQPVCDIKAQIGATMNVVDDVYSSTNTDISLQLRPNSTVTLSGKAVRPGIAGTNATFITNNLSIIPTTGTAMVFSGTISGGGFGASSVVTLSGGSITAVGGWSEGSYESSTGAPVVHRTDPVSIPYAFQGVGGGTVYAGIDTVSMIGGTRVLGPTLRQVALHVQSAAPGSSINGLNSPTAIYLDGPGTATATTNASSQAPTYVEIDINGSGSIEIQQSWNVPQGDSCHLGTGVTQVGSVHIGSNDVLTFSNGGTAQFDGSSGVTCS